MEIKEIEEKYDSLLKLEGIHGMFDIEDDLCADIYFKHIYYHTSLPYLKQSQSRTIAMLSRQLNFTRLSLLRVKYMRNGYKAKGIKEGFVYLITNPAFPSHMKIGSSIDVKSRLSTYQTYSPFRDYDLRSYYFTRDRFSEEKQYHQMMPNLNEWCEGDVDAIHSLFVAKRKYSIEGLKEYANTFGAIG